MKVATRIKRKAIRDAAFFLFTGIFLLLLFVILNSVSPQSEVQAQERSTRDEGLEFIQDDFQAVNIDTKEIDYIEDFFISYCDDNYLNSYNFDDVLVVGDRLSNYIFSEKEVVEYNCV